MGYTEERKRSWWNDKKKKCNEEDGFKSEITEIVRKKVRHKLNWKPRQKGLENWPAYLKMKRAVPSACTHASANYHGQKACSGLKYALNKLSGGEMEGEGTLESQRKITEGMGRGRQI